MLRADRQLLRTGGCQAHADSGAGTGTNAKIGPNEVRLFYIELAFKDAASIPRAVDHRLHLLAATSPGPGEPKPLDYVVASLKIAEDKPVVSERRWLARDG